MKQVFQDLETGETRLVDVPVPSVSNGCVQIAARRTLVSAGTERMLIDFGKGNLLQKARQQPDKVKQVIEKVKTDGLVPTIEAVRSKLGVPLPLGYCNVGVIIDSKVDSLSVGDRVVSNGHHAEVVNIPKNLCAKIPDCVDDDTAAFTVLGAIALQGIRLVRPTLGETVVVVGLGLIGLMAVQLLRAHGCRVLGIDFDRAKLALASSFGAETVNLADGEDPVSVALQFSRNRGVDAVLITASTSSNTPIHQAALMCRKRGRIVLVGVVGMELSRSDFYEKELSFQVSCSYGPGRYDREYEEKGHDYPIGYVRWTEQRNFEAVLDMMADGRLDVKPLISHRFKLDDAAKAFDLLSSSEPIGVLLEYDTDLALNDKCETTIVSLTDARSSNAVLGFIGAGNYASSVLVPAFSKTPARLKSICAPTGVSSVHVAKKFGIEEATTNSDKVLLDTSITALVIATRHDSHAKWILDALKNGKHVFVEKPMVLTRDELTEIQNVYQSLEEKPILMVGFNRRYAPHVKTIQSLLAAKRQPKSFIMTVNAGAIPPDHWTQDRTVGGGRIIGECCHFVDLLRYLANDRISHVTATAMETESNDCVMIQLRFRDGSIGTINYLSNGSKAFPKERLEIFCAGSVLQLNNFRSLKGYGWAGAKPQRLLRQDKGQRSCVSAFVKAIETGDASQLISLAELVEVSKACFDVDDQIRCNT